MSRRSPLCRRCHRPRPRRSRPSSRRSRDRSWRSTTTGEARLAVVIGITDPIVVVVSVLPGVLAPIAVVVGGGARSPPEVARRAVVGAIGNPVVVVVGVDAVVGAPVGVVIGLAARRPSVCGQSGARVVGVRYPVVVQVGAPVGRDVGAVRGAGTEESLASGTPSSSSSPSMVSGMRSPSVSVRQSALDVDPIASVLVPLGTGRAGPPLRGRTLRPLRGLQSYPRSSLRALLRSGRVVGVVLEQVVPAVPSSSESPVDAVASLMRSLGEPYWPLPTWPSVRSPSTGRPRRPAPRRCGRCLLRPSRCCRSCSRCRRSGPLGLGHWRVPGVPAGCRRCPPSSKGPCRTGMRRCASLPRLSDAKPVK